MQTEHTTNEQMALVMGWIWDVKLYVWVNTQGELEAPDLETWGDGWNPIADLNHAALVLEHLRAQGCHTNIEITEHGYMVSISKMHLLRTIVEVKSCKTLAELAGTCCDAAWVQPGEEFYPTE